jgi:hypothetical protein
MDRFMKKHSVMGFKKEVKDKKCTLSRIMANSAC